MFLIDAHLDLSLNAMEWNRDLRQPVEHIRDVERKLSATLAGHAQNTVALPDMRRGHIGLCVATQIAGCMKPRASVAIWESPAQAWAMTQGQLAWYRALEAEGELAQIADLASLDANLVTWQDPVEAAANHEPIGYILSLEGADSIISLDYLDRAWEYGLRAVGPAHYGEGRYAMGHDRVGGLKPEGQDLIRKIDELGLILDVTHLSEDCFWDALDLFDGPVWASHQNCRALVDDPRQFSDAQIRALIERDSVLGVACDAWMIVPNWIRGVTTPESSGVTLDHLADHIDHICQLAGNARHCGIGSDLDGGFGREQSPGDLDTIADLQRMEGILQSRGYAQEDIEGIFHDNFLRVIRNAWTGT